MYAWANTVEAPDVRRGFKTFTVRCDNVEGKEEDATGGAERMSFDVAES